MTRVLELRIHGIANAPPADTLSTSNEKIERKDGDEQGSFWQVKPTSTGTASKSPSGNTPSNVEVVTEAYSWGNQARSGGTSLALIGRAIVHLAWLLVLPFGLCNVAYWMRRDIKGAGEHPRWWVGGDGAAMVRIFALLQTLFYTVGLVTVAVYLVGLQCFRPTRAGGTGLACAALPGWLDFLVDWSPTARAALTSIVAVAVIVLVYVIGLRARGNFHPDTSLDDEGMPRKERKNVELSQPPWPPLLASTGFWLRARTTQISERTHLAAAFALVLFLLAADALKDATGWNPVELGQNLPAAAARATVPFWATAVGGALLVGTFVMAFATALSGKIEGNRIKRRFATSLVWASALSYVAWCVWAVAATRTAARADQFSGDLAFDGLVVVPTSIAALGAIIAVASLTWGYGLGYRVVSWILLAATLACVAAAEFWAKSATDPVLTRGQLSVFAFVAVALAVLWSYAPLINPAHRGRGRIVGWHGNGAAVALLLAWFSSLVITSLLVLGVHMWLTTDSGSRRVNHYWRSLDGSRVSPVIARPKFYELFAGSLVVILVIFIAIAIAGMIAALRRFPAFSLPGLMFPDEPDDEKRATQRARDEYLGGARGLVPPEEAPIVASTAAPSTTLTKGRRRRLYDRWAIPWNQYPSSEIKPAGRLRAVVEARRIAGLAHRGESLIRSLAVLTALALVPLAIPGIGDWLDGFTASSPKGAAAVDKQGTLWDTITGASGWALGLVALATVAWVVTNAVTSTERPLGLIWDIICFFPRAGHPFTPPCYSERAVPELKKRIIRFMREEEAAGNDPYVILSAHSMGATIAVATIFALYEDEQPGLPGGVAPVRPPGRSRLDRIALLTHGVQLRAYFSRFFPEVLGARVLGTRGTVGPSLLRSDPWTRQVVDEARNPRVQTAPPGDPPTVVSLLGGRLNPQQQFVAPRWRNLWRRSDYLGFPVFSHWSAVRDGVNENPIDRGASEREPRSYLWAVARHNDYLSTLQYQEARDELIAMFVGRPAEKREPKAAVPAGARVGVLRSALRRLVG